MNDKKNRIAHVLLVPILASAVWTLGFPASPMSSTADMHGAEYKRALDPPVFELRWIFDAGA